MSSMVMILLRQLSDNSDLHCVSKRDSNTINRNSKRDQQTLIIFSTNIGDTTGHQTII